MASNRFIRPVSIAYHDFIQKKYDESNQEIPLKFRNNQIDEEYVKKPIRRPKPEPSLPPAPVKEPVKKVSCWDSCMKCCSCLEPELCEDCTQKLCKKCMRQPCLKSEMCEECKQEMCEKCKKTIHGIAAEPKLRNYPIPIKRQNEYHFGNCLCEKCQRLKESQVGGRQGGQAPHSVVGANQPSSAFVQGQE